MAPASVSRSSTSSPSPTEERFRRRTRPAAARAPRPSATRAQLVLWNAGTVTVAIADLTEAPAGILAGSAALYGALALFGIELRRVRVTASRPSSFWFRGYVLLLVFLGACVVIGAALAGALPGG